MGRIQLINCDQWSLYFELGLGNVDRHILNNNLKQRQFKIYVESNSNEIQMTTVNFSNNGQVIDLYNVLQN